MPTEVAAKFDGRSLTSLLRDHAAAWADRLLFTHVGRWPKGSDAADAKFGNCSIREPRWNLVSSPRRALVNKTKPGEVLPGREPQWELFDLTVDPGETKNVAADYPDVVARLAKAYDAWWAEVQPATLENEHAMGPKVNPYHELYYKQFGGRAERGSLARPMLSSRPPCSLVLQRSRARPRSLLRSPSSRRSFPSSTIRSCRVCS